ncbi:MAG: protein-lysine N-methyltransferase [Armatimonadota bacterium]|nr:protein-lysine N-methyltransferase [Armatimonadota bacterium]
MVIMGGPQQRAPLLTTDYRMYELHQNEQYFFNDQTVTHLADFMSQFDKPCCLCTPLVGQELERRGIEVRTLDMDDRFASLRGFRAYDLYKPEWLGEEYGLILCDPPYFGVSLSQLFAAIRILSRYDTSQPLLLTYLTRRAPNLLGTFAPFGLQPTGYYPGFQTVQKVDRNQIEFYGNLGTEMHETLRSIVA